MVTMPKQTRRVQKLAQSLVFCNENFAPVNVTFTAVNATFTAVNATFTAVKVFICSVREKDALSHWFKAFVFTKKFEFLESLFIVEPTVPQHS
jgi:hypothetical protein